jgi:uncharacterized protein
MSHLFEPLRALLAHRAPSVYAARVMLGTASVQLLRELAASRAETIPGLRLVILFGSLARGKARSDSDMDLAVLGGDDWKALELCSLLASRAGREPHMVDLASASELLRFECARDGVLLYEAGPLMWAHFQAEAALRYYDLQPAVEFCAEGVRRRLRGEGAR